MGSSKRSQTDTVARAKACGLRAYIVPGEGWTLADDAHRAYLTGAQLAEVDAFILGWWHALDANTDPQRRLAPLSLTRPEDASHGRTG